MATRALLALSFLLGASLFCRAALADVPGPREVCDVDEKQGCETCWQHYGSDPVAEEAFKKCAEPLLAKGFSEACRHRQGAGDEVYYCPAGTEVGKTVRGGGCGACAVGAGEAPVGLGAGLLGIALLAVRRRRARRRA